MDCSKHKGHRTFVGGSQDGEVLHLTEAHPSDYPLIVWYPRTKELYERGLDGGTEATYRLVGHEERL